MHDDDVVDVKVREVPRSASLTEDVAHVARVLRQMQNEVRRNEVKMGAIQRFQAKFAIRLCGEIAEKLEEALTRESRRS